VVTIVISGVPISEVLRELAVRRLAEASEALFISRESGLPMLPLLGRLSAILQSLQHGGDPLSTALSVPGILERILHRLERRLPYGEAWRALLGVS